ncbi:aprataxin-like isoform X2 [Hydractinia symbiolongicarpus]|uniref:aprataxin-like isoform X2 n=1 Tax=Hydractinia symbiolongicarpus TaxID=13093 RepID=UPI00254A3728|nr:aprataxin-like isoform X2 [Hydractinia symbiolongicarpus]
MCQFVLVLIPSPTSYLRDHRNEMNEMEYHPCLKRPSLSEDKPTTSKRYKNEIKGHWTQGLKQALRNESNIELETNLVSVIKDKYPKAKYHYLVIVKAENISSVKSLNSTHIDLLKHMIDVAQGLESSIQKNDRKATFWKGFHAVPSMTLMHMHVISMDFDSKYLRHKRHWNSFTTDFFRPVSSVLKQLEDEGCVTIDNFFYKQMLETPLKCHLCSEKPKNMPRLKDHIKTHF